MKLREQALLVAVAVGTSEAFAPPVRFARPSASSSSARSFGVEPSAFHDIVSQAQNVFSTLSIADAVDAVPDTSSLMDRVSEAVSAAPSAVESVSTAVENAAQTAVDPSSAVDSAQAATGAAVDAAATATDNGWFGFLTGPTIALLQLIHAGLVSAGLGQNSWGVSIIALTLLIKAATFPLTKTQLESTNKMQTIQPQIKDIQAKYQSNPEVMNQKMAELYQTNDINPLAGCIPAFAQIPVFIGLYRAVLDLAKENKLDEPFLFLPSLEGPVYGADPSQATSWLFNWVDGAPALGWDDTISFLILPVFLVASQFLSMELMSPKDQPQQGNAVLKFLPFLIGYFSLSVPSALSVYWVTNNIVTTSISLLIRNNMKTQPVAVSPTMEPPTPSEIFSPSPLKEKPSGFSPPEPASRDGITPITSSDASVIEAEIESATEAAREAVPGGSKRGGSKKRKKRKKN